MSTKQQQSQLPSALKSVPEGCTALHESTTEIIVPSTSLPDSAGKRRNDEEGDRKSVFLNPVQEYNRDLSIVAIRAWSEIFAAEKKAKEIRSMERKRLAKEAIVPTESTENDLKSPDRKRPRVENSETKDEEEEDDGSSAPQSKPKSPNEEIPDDAYKFTLFEGLSATGIRSIRYAKEIPLLKWVLANDLSTSAAESIAKNVEWNDLGTPTISKGLPNYTEFPEDCKIRVNEGDCSAILYANRQNDDFDCIDLDPYGAATPFIDGAVQSVSNGGLLCVTCTDLAVLAGKNYPEKCYNNYGGTPVRAEFSHEVALRLVLHSLATSAARYGRYIKPLLSLSIDFYVRVFIRVYNGAQEAKKTFTNTGTVLVSAHSQDWRIQPLGQMVIKENGSKRVGNFKHANNVIDTLKSPEDRTAYHLGGPMWIGPLHDTEFIDKMLQHVNSADATYGTKDRIKGMITVARSELDTPFYFAPGKLSGAFKSASPPLTTVASALLNAGYKVSRSHALAGSLKTDAPSSFVHDIFRVWVEQNPIHLDKITDGTPPKNLYLKTVDDETRKRVDFTNHPNVKDILLDKIKLVRYQQNPTAHWGPQSGATKR